MCDVNNRALHLAKKNCSENNISAEVIESNMYENVTGIYDMSGNVSEWCLDWYGSYSSDDQIDPQGPATGTYKVYRGGHWWSTGVYMTSRSYCSASSYYYYYYNSTRNYYGMHGLRLVMEP